MRGPSYIGLTRSISWLLMPWLLTSPGHQQPWYWLYRICRPFSYLRKDFKYLCQINVEEWYKMQIYVYVSSEKFSTKRVNRYPYQYWLQTWSWMQTKQLVEVGFGIGPFRFKVRPPDLVLNHEKGLRTRRQISLAKRSRNTGAGGTEAVPFIPMPWLPHIYQS